MPKYVPRSCQLKYGDMLHFNIYLFSFFLFKAQKPRQQLRSYYEGLTILWQTKWNARFMMHCVWLSVSWSPSLSFLVVERWRPLYLYIWKTLQPHWYACKTVAINVFISRENLHFLCVTQTLKSGIYPAMKFCKCYKYRN